MADVDDFPFVDVRVTSLSRSFSGGCNVAGGSVVINPDSQNKDAICKNLESIQDTLCPLDAEFLYKNCHKLLGRVLLSNRNALQVVRLLTAHEAVAKVNHPSQANSKMFTNATIVRTEGTVRC
ncbi:hypothetical protein BJY01DRAFT_251823 [Aspergillus pseudoustus]|uniref:Uncharacterized protein n=1 Tax=Aspergillus pseudoustus TaxID=1810923 RepID=A0ABR4J9K8_9EURO